jgi:GAG-pre-integrase domain
MDKQSKSGHFNLCITETFSNYVGSLLVMVLIAIGLFDILQTYFEFVKTLQALGYGILAPLSWLIVFLFFLKYQPVVAVPPPESEPPKFNRKQKRCFGRLLRKALPPKKRQTHPSIWLEGFHRSYPMCLRGAGIYQKRLSAPKVFADKRFAYIKCKYRRYVPPPTHSTTGTTQREGVPNKINAVYSILYSSKKMMKKEPQRYNLQNRFPSPEPNESLFHTVPFEKMNPAQKVAVSNITNYVSMYRPAPSQYKGKKVTAVPTSKQVPNHYRTQCVTNPKAQAHIAQLKSQGESPIVHFIGQCGLAWFRTSSTKIDRSDTIIWDSGASVSISPNRDDFLGKIEPVNTTIQGISPEEVGVKGHGFVAWPMEDVNGMLRILKVPCLGVPKIPQRLLSTSSLLIEAYVDPKNNLPTTIFYDSEKTKEVAQSLANLVTTVSAANRNLSSAEKELLKWHQRLAHIDFRKVSFLFHTGVLSNGVANRQLHTAASEIAPPPKCTACQFGKQCQRSVPTTTQAKVSDKVGAISRKCTLPGEQISVDHFVCKVKGRLSSSKGKTDESQMYLGGCVFVDHYSGMIHV